MSRQHEILKELFEETIELGFMKYTETIEDINFYDLACISASRDKLKKIFGGNVCMFNYLYEDEDSILIIFSIPLSEKNEGTKFISEKVIEIIKVIEESFITFDYVDAKEVKEDHFAYVIIVKKIERENGD